MASVADLVEPELRERAGEYLVRAGEVLRDAGRVRLAEFGPERVTATVTDDGDWAVRFVAGPAGLEVACDCGNASATGWCPHAVAVAIETWERSPRRR